MSETGRAHSWAQGDSGLVIVALWGSEPAGSSAPAQRPDDSYWDSHRDSTQDASSGGEGLCLQRQSGALRGGEGRKGQAPGFLATTQPGPAGRIKAAGAACRRLHGARRFPAAASSRGKKSPQGRLLKLTGIINELPSSPLPSVLTVMAHCIKYIPFFFFF